MLIGGKILIRVVLAVPFSMSGFCNVLQEVGCWLLALASLVYCCAYIYVNGAAC